MATYDILGTIVMAKFSRTYTHKQKQQWAAAFLLDHAHVTTVLEKSERIKGRLRVPKTTYIAGLRTKEALYKENGCVFRFNVDTCYFSPRLAAERKEIAGLVKKGDSVLVLFGGVGPFAIVIAKKSKAKRVVSLELGRECTKYALENVRRNKLAVTIIQGNVRRKLPVMRETFDRIVMARPNLTDPFLDVTFPRVKKGGIIHYYGFCHEEELAALTALIKQEATKAGRKIRIINTKRAGDIGPYKYRYRFDIRVIS